MTKFQTVLLAILAGLVAGLLYKFVPDQPALSGGVASVALLLLGWAKQHPADAAQIAAQPKDSGHAHVTTMVLLAAFAGLCLAPACTHTPTSPDSFYSAVVTCTESNTSNAQAGAAVVSCLTNAVGGNYAACLQGLVTGGYWTVQEVACLVRAYATTAAQKLNAGTSATTDEQGLSNANEWMRAKHIQFSRSSP